MRFGNQLWKEIALQKSGVTVGARSLQKRPDAIFVRGARHDIRLAVTVEVVGKHIGTSFAELGGVKPPRSRGFGAVGGLLPPTARTDHIEPAIAVYVADAEPVG